ncbi:uncharacterized protein zgc:194930 [Trichomycterus rosablanca]|uniref:uncharacterized protein zgc:194930 n=1 Tax=Trichomycterus rosablanca TaxID=2290929 RepID=UPI002F357033
MGCRCCRMVNGYVNDPAGASEDINGIKQDPSTSSLVSSYRGHRFSVDGINEKEGFHNFGYTSSSQSDIDNNHINKAKSNQPSGSEPSLYILQPDGGDSATLPSAPPLCNELMLGTEPGNCSDRFRDSGLGNGGLTDRTDGSDGYLCGQEERAGSAGDTADEESVISVDIHTSSTSLSSSDTKLVIDDRDEGDESFSQTKKKNEDSVSITDSMVEEALAALEAATAGEEFE